MLVIGVFGCQKQSTPKRTQAQFQLVRFSVDDGTPVAHRPIGFDKAQLSTMLESALGSIGLHLPSTGQARSPWSSFKEELRRLGLPAPRDAWQVRLHAQTVYGIATNEGIATSVQTGLSKAVWSVDLRLQSPEHDESVYSYIETTDESAFVGNEEAARREIHGRLAASLMVLTNQIELRMTMASRHVDDLIEALDMGDAEVRLAAVEHLSMVKTERAALAMAKRLSTETESTIRLRIIGALAESKSQSVIDTLISIADPRDRETLRAILDALSAIGGQRVLDFLGVLSSHDAPDIREMVLAARSRLRRSQEEAARRKNGKMHESGREQERRRSR